MHRLRRRHDWALGLAPQELAGRSEGLLFAALCLLALWLVAVADFVAPRHSTVGAIALLPVAAASWLLSRRLIVLVVTVAMLLGLAEAAAGVINPITALSQVAMMPMLSVLARLAATNVVRSRSEERNARQARELERAKSDFLRLASHELRGPVAILRGYLSMLEDGTLGDMPPAIEKVVPVLVATSAGMTRTVDQMLDVARLEDSRLQLNLSRGDLSECVRQAATNVGILHGESHQVVVHADRRVLTEFDPLRIATVVGNLVSNAIKYSPAGSKVTVELSTADREASIAVTDSGIGIRPDDVGRLFTRFGRIVEADTRGVPGTGLGLYLSRELARLHGGDITVSSQRGRGSTFTLRLPLGRSGAQPHVALEPRLPRTGGHGQVAS